MKHGINNTGWMMKWWWNGGAERSANPNIERMLNIFNLHFSTPEEKAVSRICTSKTRRNLQTFGWCLKFKHSCPWAALPYFCLLKQSRENQCNRVSRFKEKCLGKAQHYQSSLKEEKALCKMNSLTFTAKKPQPLLWKLNRKGRREKKENLWPLAHNAKVHREGVWRGQGGGGQWRLLYAVFTWIRWYVSDMTICKNT